MRNLFGIIAVWFIWSCAHDHDDRKPDARPVSFTSGIHGQVMSRAMNNSWDAGDVVGIYMVPATANASDAANLSSAYADVASNIPYATSGNGTLASLSITNGYDPIFYPEQADAQVNFVAYYPYMADIHDIYKVDVATQSPSKEIDLLYHKGTGTPYSLSLDNVPLEFTHRLSKFKINLVPADEVSADLTDATVTLSGFPTTADFNLSTGTLDVPGNADVLLTPVKDAANSSAVQAAFEAIVVPHTNNPATYTRVMTFTIEGYTYLYTLDASNAFEAGVAHSYSFRFTGDKIILSQNTIVNWQNGTVVWGDYLLTVNRFYFDLDANATSGNTVNLSLNNTTTTYTWELSDAAGSTTIPAPSWITDVTLTGGTPPAIDGWVGYTLTFGTMANPDPAPRTAYIRLKMATITLPIRVTQAAAGP